ncbi:hypothetical protein [Massilia oculi]|uniref:hypothetical protein n=1 Tax=Massilia oculi TaxID=945844 RepID=UPI0013B3811F|nr:hypothetical protein [Massilia oculi]
MPDQFQFSHQYCFFLHDQLVSLLKGGEAADIFSHEWKVVEGEAHPPLNLSGEELFQWLERNNKKDVVFSLYYKQICAALVSDMLNFVYEALSCSAKGKLTVAFALLRKPLKENLFFLEWLLARPSEMLAAFDGDYEHKSINKRFSDSEKKQIIKEAAENSHAGEWLPAELIYDVRYNKNFSIGFEALFQKANHLVTSFRFLETERANLNFVFSDEDAWQSQWEGLYSFLPIMLFHTVQIVKSIIGNFSRFTEQRDLDPVRALIGLALWFQHRPTPIEARPILESIAEALLEITCPQCGGALDASHAALERIYIDNVLSCKECTWSHRPY